MRNRMLEFHGLVDSRGNLITDKKITNIQELVPILEQIMQQGRPPRR